MAFPDTTIGNQFSTGFINATDLHNKVDLNLDLLGARVQDSGWVTATLGNSWVSFDAGAVFQIPRYRKFHGVVYLDGVMKSGTTTTTVFTLPVGYRPVKTEIFAGISVTGVARIDVLATGVIQVATYSTGGSNANVSLSNIHFIAEQ